MVSNWTIHAILLLTPPVGYSSRIVASMQSSYLNNFIVAKDWFIFSICLVGMTVGNKNHRGDQVFGFQGLDNILRL